MSSLHMLQKGTVIDGDTWDAKCISVFAFIFDCRGVCDIHQYGGLQGSASIPKEPPDPRAYILPPIMAAGQAFPV